MTSQQSTDGRRARRRLGVLAATGTVVLGAVGTAYAARVESTEILSIPTLSITAAAGETNVIRVTQPIAGENPIRVEDEGAVIDAGPGCTRSAQNARVAICIGANRAAIGLGDGDDELYYSHTVGASINGGTGRDLLHGGPRNDSIDGGDGPDVMVGVAGADVFRGGEAFDSVSYTATEAFPSYPAGPVTATIDGTANDGAEGEGDNVGTDVEGLSGSRHGDRLTGSNAANGLRGFDGIDTLSGLGGDDDLGGGAGDDDLTGGAGRDRLDGGDGNDEIHARDRSGDTIDCGSGIDVVHLDLADEAVGCEVADLGPFAQVGLFRLRPSRSTARAGRPVTLTLTWTAPLRWRDLRTVDLRVRSGGRTVGVVRFREDGSPTGRLALGRRSGTPGGSGTLRNGPLSLLLAQSTVQGSGPSGRTVAMKIVLRFARALAGRTLTLELGASDDRGRTQRFRPAGRITVR